VLVRDLGGVRLDDTGRAARPARRDPGPLARPLRGADRGGFGLYGFPTNQSPNLWWPRDHAWCVASEIDFCSTYLGGSRALVERVLADESLEAIPVRLEDRGIKD